MFLDPADPAFMAYASAMGRDPRAQMIHDSLTWSIPAMGWLLWLGTTRTAWERMRRMAGQEADSQAFERYLGGRFPAIPAPGRRLAA